jgi:putative transposase
MERYRTQFPVQKMAKVLKVSRSGFYAWLKHPESDREKQTRLLDALIQAEYERSKKRSGSIKITHALRAKGHAVGRNRVARRMHSMGLRSKVRRKFRVTTNSKHKEPVAPNLLNRQFTTELPNQVWVSDITYLWTQAGWVYLTVFLDLYSRMVVGWSVSTCLGHQSVLQALWRAVGRRGPLRGLLIHSDRGVQYACGGFRAALEQHGFIQSMSRKGNCWDNAVAESFFKTLKTEWYYHTRLLDIDHAEQELFEYIEQFYNGQRQHASLGYLSPVAFETQKLRMCA